MAPGSIRHQAEELDELLGVERSRVLVRHRVRHSRAEEIYQEARSEDHDRAHTERGQASCSQVGLAVATAVSHAWQIYRQDPGIATRRFRTRGLNYLF